MRAEKRSWFGSVFVCALLAIAFVARHAWAQEKIVEEKVSESAKAVVKRCAELRGTTSIEFLKADKEIREMYDSFDIWIRGRGGWGSLTPSDAQQAWEVLRQQSTTARSRMEAAVARILKMAEVEADALGSKVLLVVGAELPQREGMNERLKRLGWSGKWTGWWEDVASGERQWFTLVMLEDGEKLSGIMRDEDGSVAVISGSQKWDDEKKIYQLQLIKRYQTSGVEACYTAKLAPDLSGGSTSNTNFLHEGLFPNEIEGVWSKPMVTKDGQNAAVVMGTWRMWPLLK